MCLSLNSRYLRELIGSLLSNISRSLTPYFDEFSINKYLCGEVNGLQLRNVASPGMVLKATGANFLSCWNFFVCNTTIAFAF
jgi:hypothetical protein